MMNVAWVDDSISPDPSIDTSPAPHLIDFPQLKHPLPRLVQIRVVADDNHEGRNGLGNLEL